MRFNLKTILAAAAIVLLGAVACKPDDIIPEPDPAAAAVSNINYDDDSITDKGATVTVKFDAAAAWVSELRNVTKQDKEWIAINENTLSGKAGTQRSVRVTVQKNNTDSDRTAELWITVDGYEAVKVAELKQVASGLGPDAELNKSLNTQMHEILCESYLWNEEYKKLDIDLTCSYSDFLNKHLLAMGDVNEEDGGYYRASQANGGERFIYSFISENQNVSTKSMAVAGLGFGPFLSTALSENGDDMGIAVSYARVGSPAQQAGLRRGDVIISVNGTRLTKSNYRSYMNSLYASPSGSYVFTYLRYEQNNTGGYNLNQYQSGTATAEAHVYDPVLYASIIKDPDNEATKIGYLVFEAFQYECQEFLVQAIDEFIAAGINEMILDLRFNTGGDMSQSRWLSGCIAGEANWDKTFAKVVYNDESSEDWKFNYGYSNDSDQLGLPKDLHLNRLFVITSYNTASSAELVINALRGIDMPVKLIGCNTEGKNVGMRTSELKFENRSFTFAPITFWTFNAKGFGDFRNGFTADEYVNNDNTSYNDDADNVFPYSFGDWGNMDYNIALQWAYCDITGKKRWDDWSKLHTKSESGFVLQPLDFQPLNPEFGRYGIIMNNN